MRLKIMAMCLALLAVGGAPGVRAQETAAAAAATSEQRVSLEAEATALDAQGRAALVGQLLTQALAGTPDAPVRNARFIIENRGPVFLAYVSGSVTFYDDRGVRCGEGQFTLSALAQGERAETDAPGLRITCAPRTWRIVAKDLLPRATERISLPEQEEAAQPLMPATAPADTPAVLPLEITVDDKVYNAPIGSTLEVSVRRRRVRITVRAAQ
ncbi:MAG TPA: hypothetical protein VJ715_19935 [Pyrinomonadaceae bacterium]|nr:hypothetical protein [Pyrinomonadaceae bacterium]